EEFCTELGVPHVGVLDPVHAVLYSYLDAKQASKVGGQHELNAEYFHRIEALNFTMMHDDGQLHDEVGKAEVVLVGVSRTSKTPTSIYLANRGIKAANIPIVSGIALPKALEKARRPLIVGLIASPERIVQIRRNRLLSLNADENTDYVDKRLVANEINDAKRLFSAQNWPVIDVTRRSIEETAAAIMTLLRKKQQEAGPAKSKP
ncbi:MAG: pyruvate, water dikinase regulatory protein, partial [Alphaproteobacteria bacterium]